MINFLRWKVLGNAKEEKVLSDCCCFSSESSFQKILTFAFLSLLFWRVNIYNVELAGMNVQRQCSDERV